MALVSRGTVAHGKGPSAQESPKKIINMNQFFEAPPLKTNYDLSITLEKSRNIDPNHDFFDGELVFFNQLMSQGFKASTSEGRTYQGRIIMSSLPPMKVREIKIGP